MGLLVWVCLLAEAKRNVPEGRVRYCGDHHFWSLLGLSHEPPEFTPETFLTFTGRLKQTKKTRSGRVFDVVLTHWGDWQDDWRRDSERERKSRNRAASRRDTNGTANGTELDKKRTEKEIEKEKEKYPPNPPRGELVQVYEHWLKVRGKTDPRYKKISPGRRKKIEARQREFTTDQLLQAIDAVALDPWEDRPRHDDLTIIFRSQEQVDRFLAFRDPGQNGNALSAEEKIARTIARQR